MLLYDGDTLIDLVTELDRWKTELDYRGPVPRTWAGRLRRDLEVEAVAASTSMEGVPVTVEQVHHILVGDRPAQTREEDAALVRGYRDAMSFVLRRADDAAFKWDRELLIGLHDRILAGNWGAGAGRLRTGPAHLVDNRTGQLVFQPPSADQVPELIDRTCSIIERGLEHPAIAAAWIHAAVAAIHPFADGNGRAARVVASLAMYRGGFKLPEFTSLEEWWGRHLSDYYASFRCLGEAFDANANVTPFIRAHLEAQLHQVRALDLRERVQQRIWTAIEEVVTTAGLEPRVANAVWDAFFGRSVTPRYYRPLADVSVATATNDLAATVAAGLLRPAGRARSRSYHAGDSLYARIGSILGVAVTESGEPGRGMIIGELTKRVASRIQHDQEKNAVVTDEEVVTSKLEDILRGQGRRLQIRCTGTSPDDQYVVEAWVGNYARPSGRRKRDVLDKAQLDQTSTSGPLKPQVEAVLTRFFHALSPIPDDPHDREMFPIFVDGISGNDLGAYVRSLVAGAPNGMTAEAVTNEILVRTQSRSGRSTAGERVRNVLDHLTLRSHQGLDYKDGHYRAR